MLIVRSKGDVAIATKRSACIERYNRRNVKRLRRNEKPLRSKRKDGVITAVRNA